MVTTIVEDPAEIIITKKYRHFIAENQVWQNFKAYAAINGMELNEALENLLILAENNEGAETIKTKRIKRYIE